MFDSAVYLLSEDLRVSYVVLLQFRETIQWRCSCKLSVLCRIVCSRGSESRGLAAFEDLLRWGVAARRLSSVPL